MERRMEVGIEGLFTERKLHPAPGFVLAQGAENEETRASGLIAVLDREQGHGLVKGVVLEQAGDSLGMIEYAQGSLIHWLAGHEYEVGDYKLVPERDIVAWEEA